MTHPMKNRTAIVGLGITEMGRVYRSASDLACEAVFLALKDAGLNKSKLDGLLINAGLLQSGSSARCADQHKFNVRGRRSQRYVRTSRATPYGYLRHHPRTAWRGRYISKNMGWLQRTRYQTRATQHGRLFGLTLGRRTIPRSGLLSRV